MPFKTVARPNVSSGRFHFVPFNEIPALAVWSISVKAQVAYLPSFQLARLKTEMSFVNS
jgi:hypothetical protein